MRCWVALALAAAVKAAADSRDVELLGDGSIAVPTLGVLHAEWLRERCKHVTSVDPITRQRLLNPHEYAPPVVTNATLAGAAGAEVLRVSFRDGHESEFSVPLLRTMMGASVSGFVQFDEALRPAQLLWNATLGGPPLFAFAEVAAEASDAYVADERRRLYGVLQSAGVAVVRGAPTEEGVCSALASDLSTLRTTEWGEQFNVRSEPDLLQASGAKFDLAYTAKAIGQHTDNPYRYPTPDFQLLHAIEQCSCEQDHGVPAPCDGCTVMNYFADGFAVAERMATETPELFDSLASVAVRFENNGGDGSSAVWHDVPHLEMLETAAPGCRGARCLRAVRFSAKSGGYAPPLPPAELETFYAAKRRFSQLIHEPAMTIRMQLRRGDVVIFDNKRLLHSRSAIAPGDGARFVQGCYLDRDGIEYKWERLRRAAATFTDLETAPKADYERMGERYGAIDVGDRLLGLLLAQKGAYLAQPVDLLEHGLQVASRALRAGESDDLVVAGLFHDVTESLSPKGHGEAAAALLAPYVDRDTHWLLFHHEVFQGYYYYHHFGADKHARDRLWSDESADAWRLTARWCHDYDQKAFDPSYPSLPVDAFRGAVARVLSREPYWWDPDHPKRAAVTGSA